jgi:hypothetical protein
VTFTLCDGAGVIDLKLPAEPADTEEDSEAVQRASQWGVTLYAEDATPTGMTLLTNQKGNHFNGELEYDSCCYYLEMLQDGTWVEVSPLVGGDCMLEGTHVMPNACCREKLDWKQRYGTLSPGQYRLVRHFFDYSVSCDNVNLYAPFVITEAHTCVSEDQDLLCDRCLCLMEHPCEDQIGDAECDICGKRISEEAVYRVVGNADWMGNHYPRCNQGIMREQQSDVYVMNVQNVTPGKYVFLITKNGEDGLWGEWSDRYEFTVSQTTDLTVTLDLRDGLGQVTVNGSVPLDLKVPANQDTLTKTKDYSVIPIVMTASLVLFAVAFVLLLLNKRKRIR